MTDFYPSGSPTGAQRMATMMDFLNEPVTADDPQCGHGVPAWLLPCPHGCAWDEGASIAVPKQELQPPDLVESGPTCRYYSSNKEHFCGRAPWHTDDHWCPTCKASWSR